MNEKVYELLETVRRTAVTVSDMAVDAAYAAGKKGGELVDTAKKHIRLQQRKADVEAALCELGAMLYATHTGNPTESDELLAKMEEIDALRAEIAAMEEELGREIVPICGTCGAVVQENNVYCRACGDKL